MRALVTGVGGFVGAHLAARLVADGWDVAGTVRPGRPAPRLAALGVGEGVHVIAADLADREQAAAVARRAAPDVAFLLAAARSAGSARERAATAAVNGLSALWLTDALPAWCPAVVRLGSSTEYGPVEGPTDEQAPLRPRNFFGATKAAGSLLLAAAAAERGLRAAVLRPFQVYGPLDHDGRLVPTLLRAARREEPVSVTGPGRRRDWVFVDDVVEACIRAACDDALPPGQVLNIGTGRQAANEELVAEVERVTGRALTVSHDHRGRDWDADNWVCDPSLARRLLGWEATVGLTEGLARCWEAKG
ncbi:MAG TPA: NAD(P)-dependent oxidoreductase [Acidimicrobiales bacterium]|nr:NAD(P)-dependent oxidoreductase [Acidimicrobiales bacterium]